VHSGVGAGPLGFERKVRDGVFCSVTRHACGPMQPHWSPRFRGCHVRRELISAIAASREMPPSGSAEKTRKLCRGGPVGKWKSSRRQPVPVGARLFTLRRWLCMLAEDIPLPLLDRRPSETSWLPSSSQERLWSAFCMTRAGPPLPSFTTYPFFPPPGCRRRRRRRRRPALNLGEGGRRDVSRFWGDFPPS